MSICFAFFTLVYFAAPIMPTPMCTAGPIDTGHRGPGARYTLRGCSLSLLARARAPPGGHAAVGGRPTRGSRERDIKVKCGPREEGPRCLDTEERAAQSQWGGASSETLDPDSRFAIVSRGLLLSVIYPISLISQIV